MSNLVKKDRFFARFSFVVTMEEPGEQRTVVFALIVTEPALECVCVCGGGGWLLNHWFRIHFMQRRQWIVLQIAPRYWPSDLIYAEYRNSTFDVDYTELMKHCVTSERRQTIQNISEIALIISQIIAANLACGFFCVFIRGGHWHWQIGRMHDTDLIPDIRSKGVKDRTFSKNRRQRSCPLLWSLSIVDDPDV